MIYLVHFSRPLHHAAHYLGYVQGGFPELKNRLQQHRNGTGARLMTVIKEHGISFQLVRVWEEGDRKQERRLKKRGKGRLCPVCCGRDIILPEALILEV